MNSFKECLISRGLVRGRALFTHARTERSLDSARYCLLNTHPRGDALYTLGLDLLRTPYKLFSTYNPLYFVLFNHALFAMDQISNFAINFPKLIRPRPNNHKQQPCLRTTKQERTSLAKTAKNKSSTYLRHLETVYTSATTASSRPTKHIAPTHNFANSPQRNNFS